MKILTFVIGLIFDSMKNTIVVIIMLFVDILSLQASVVDSLLIELDKELDQRAYYEQQKVNRIEAIKRKIELPSLSLEESYHLYKSLYQEYESYSCDSALFYINKNIDIAIQLNNDRWLLSSKLSKLSVLIASGLYVEGMALLETLPRNELKGADLLNYYIANSNIHLYLSEYTASEYKLPYMEIVNNYCDSILSLAPEGSHQFVVTRSQVLFEGQQWDEAKDLLENYLAKQTPDCREYAVAASILAYVHHLSGDVEKEKEARILSAIADIKAVVKESYSLCALAELLYNEGQLDRANKYIKINLEVTNKYKARLRSYQTSNILPLIDQAWQKEKDEQRQRLYFLIMVVSVLAVILLLMLVYVILQMKKLRTARREILKTNTALQNLNGKLKHLNASLAEANCVKEEYLGCFLQQCSVYIDKLDNYRRMLNKKAASGKLEELFALLKSNQMVEKELKEFYHHFDTSFLRIFPNFVEEFNQLFPPEERIVPKNSELLTTELRIFALIRLGITDSTLIAGFLRYSITTIYTYRSKMKKKSLYKEDFEERVMKISSF